MKTTEDVLLAEANGASATVGAAVNAPARRVVRVWVVDDNADLRGLFAQLLNSQPGIRCTRTFPSAEAILATLAEERPPDVLLLDINLGGQSGLKAIRPIKKLAPSVKVLMWTMFSNTHYEAEAFRSGASGFLLKSYEVDEIVKLIHEAHRNPGAACLFPNMELIEKAGASGSARPLSLIGTLRRLYTTPRRQAAR
jgi:DNA-binding NarL/FixJ family response regulator